MIKVNIVGRGQVYDELIKHKYWDALLIEFTRKPIKADLLVLSGYSLTIKQATMKEYTYGVVNIHTSLLPKYRGRHPVVWAMINGDPIGVTIHYIQDETIDTGDIILQEPIRYDLNDTYGEVMNRLCAIIPLMLNNAMKQVGENTVHRVKQDETQATYFPRRTPKDSLIPNGIETIPLVRMVNALTDPLPNAYMEHEDTRIYFKGLRYEKRG